MMYVRVLNEIAGSQSWVQTVFSLPLMWIKIHEQGYGFPKIIWSARILNYVNNHNTNRSSILLPLW